MTRRSSPSFRRPSAPPPSPSPNTSPALTVARGGELDELLIHSPALSLNTKGEELEDPLLALIDQVGSLSTVDPQVALRQPVAQVVAATLDAACDSPHTRRNYQNSIGLFLEYLDQERGERLPAPYAEEWRPFAVSEMVGRRKVWTFKPPAIILRLLVDARILDRFRQAQLDKGLTIESAYQREYPVRSFLAVAYRDGILTTEQALAMNLKAFRARRKRDHTPVGRRLAREEVRTLQAAIPKHSRKGKRDRALIDVMLYLGLRRQEVTTLSTNDFVRDHGYWWLELLGKARKRRKLKLSPPLLESLQRWLDALGVTLGIEETPLFCVVNRGDRIQKERPIDVSTVSRLVAEYGHKAKIASQRGKGRLSPHDLRRTAARTAYEQGASLLQVQQMLGHASPMTTQQYIGELNDVENTATDRVRY